MADLDDHGKELRANYDAAFKKLVLAFDRGTGAHLTREQVIALGICLSNNFSEYDEKGRPLEEME